MRLFGAEGGEEVAAVGEGDVGAEVGEGVFCRRIERSGFVLGTQVARWWVQVEPETAPFGGEPWKVYHEETAADFFAKLRSLDAEGGALTTRRLVVVLLLAGALQQLEAVTAADAREDLVDRVLEELVGAANMFGDASSGAVTQRFGTAATEDAEAQEFAESLAYGWPDVHDQPTLPCAPGRFAKSSPLKFPMRVADLYGEQDISVTSAACTQHPFRLP